jgi:hypothetical protein
MFIESLGNASLNNGILRIEGRIRGGDGKEQVTGHLVIPAQNAAQVAKQLTTILRELKKRIDEQAAAQKAAAGEKPIQ